MTGQWSEETKENTRAAFEDFSFGTMNEKVWLKHFDRHFGVMCVPDAVNHNYVIYSPTGDKLLATFDSISDLIESGWVLD